MYVAKTLRVNTKEKLTSNINYTAEEEGRIGKFNEGVSV
jgi:hypothetical protein